MEAGTRTSSSARTLAACVTGLPGASVLALHLAGPRARPVPAAARRWQAAAPAPPQPRTRLHGRMVRNDALRPLQRAAPGARPWGRLIVGVISDDEIRVPLHNHERYCDLLENLESFACGHLHGSDHKITTFSILLVHGIIAENMDCAKGREGHTDRPTWRKGFLRPLPQ